MLLKLCCLLCIVIGSGKGNILIKSPADSGASNARVCESYFFELKHVFSSNIKHIYYSSHVTKVKVNVFHKTCAKIIKLIFMIPRMKIPNALVFWTFAAQKQTW